MEGRGLGTLSHISSSSDVQVKDNVYGFTKKNSNLKESFALLLVEILSNVQNPLQIALREYMYIINIFQSVNLTDKCYFETTSHTVLLMVMWIV